MAKINLQKRKQLSNKKIKIEFDGLFEDVEFKLTQDLADTIKDYKKTQEEELLKAIMKKLKIKNIENLDKTKIQSMFFEQVDLEEATAIQKKTLREFNIVEKTFHSIAGVPAKEELMTKLKENLEDDFLVKETYFSLINDTFLEINNFIMEVSSPS